jgi:hypothetical protein
MVLDYQYSKIYVIKSYQTDKIYIGSTVLKLGARLTDHKKSNKKINKKCSSKIITDLGDSYIELLELFPCDSRTELNKREGALIRLYKDNVVNRNIAGRTSTEYRQDNQDKLMEKRKVYVKANKEAINIKEKAKYQKNKEQNVYQERIKVYRQENKEAIKQYQKLYREAKKLALLKPITE